MGKAEQSASVGVQGRASFWAGLVLAVLLFGGTRLIGLSFAEQATAAIAGLCAVWWVAQPVPIPVTSLLPFGLLPLFGVVADKEVAHSFGHHLVLLLMAGFMLSAAIEASGAHRRLALGMAKLVSGGGLVSPRRLLLGFMLASAFASMWISNTATTLILLPIALASSSGDDSPGLREKLLLGVAYGASIGGIGTPIGTPPNLLFMASYEKLGNAAWTFTEWMSIGLPVVVLMLPLAYFSLTRGLPKAALPPLPNLGEATTREKRVLLVFGITAMLWVTRLEPFGGWTALLGFSGVGDSTVAFVGLLAMLIVPDGTGRRLLTWSEAEKIPWGILLLFGGGIALAGGFKASGLSETLGQSLSGLASAPEFLMILGVSLAVTFLTEVTSNTATTALLMPILGSTALASGIDPVKLMVPAALSASCAFMLPVATAPNAIIFGSGHVKTATMARHGLLLNLAGALIISTLCSFLL